MGKHRTFALPPLYQQGIIFFPTHPTLLSFRHSDHNRNSYHSPFKNCQASSIFFFSSGSAVFSGDLGGLPPSAITTTMPFFFFLSSSFILKTPFIKRKNHGTNHPSPVPLFRCGIPPMYSSSPGSMSSSSCTEPLNSFVPQFAKASAIAKSS